MIVDGAIVGRGIGVQALAAVGAIDWCFDTYMIWSMLLLAFQSHFSMWSLQWEV